MLLVWQFTRAAGDGLQLQVLNPNLELIWKSAIVVPVTVGTVCSSAVWMRRTWTMPLAVVNASANWIAAVVTVSLAAEGILFTPPVPAGPGVQNDYRPLRISPRCSSSSSSQRRYGTVSTGSSVHDAALSGDGLWLFNDSFTDQRGCCQQPFRVPVSRVRYRGTRCARIS